MDELWGEFLRRSGELMGVLSECVRGDEIDFEGEFLRRSGEFFLMGYVDFEEYFELW